MFRFDYRGAGDSEGDFQDVTLEGKISDTLKCLDFLANDSQIDASRLGLLGRSLGGVVAIVAARRSQMIKSLALWAPVFKSDPWKKLWENLMSNQNPDQTKQKILQHFAGDIPNLEFLSQFFELNLWHELQMLQNVPLLHIHGEQDQIVKIEHAKDFEKARSGIENTQFLKLPKSGHDFSDIQEQNIAIQETCRWFEKTLCNVIR